METKFKLGNKVFYKDMFATEKGIITGVLLKENCILYHIDDSEYSYTEAQIDFVKENLEIKYYTNQIERLKESIKHCEDKIKEINE